MSEMNVQVDKNHYNFSSYVNLQRWCSYYFQIKEILCFAKNKVLIIGKGDGITADIISGMRPKLQIITADFDESLNPDICTDVCLLSKHIDLKHRPDTILCCQVLEHMPFDHFKTSIKEIHESLDSDGTFILSLPDSGFKIGGRIDIPKFHHEFTCKLLRFWKTDFKFEGEHYWEINSARKYSVKAVRSIIKRYFEIQDEYIVQNNDYHRFFILKPL